MFSRVAVGGRRRLLEVGIGRDSSAARRRLFSSTAARRVDFEHVVIGAGAVGLAIARALAQRNPSTLLLERHLRPGTETSSRNSEVIHAGLYYGPDTLKTDLCIRGRELLYGFCAAHAVPHRNCGKLIVAQDDAGRAALEDVFRHCEGGALGGGRRAPVRWVGREELARREPAVRAEAGCLESPATGIVDSHALMVALLGLFEDAGGTFAPGSPVTAVRPLPGAGLGRKPGAGGWEVTVRGRGAGQGWEEEEEQEEGEGTTTTTTTTITAATLVNAAGLGAVDIHNLIAPPAQHRKLYYAKGNYFSYAASHPRVNTLVYPAPVPGHGGLGTHLTLDMAGRIKFGPDVEWVDSPDDLAVNGARMAAAVEEIRRYLPGVDVAALAPDYAGIRPKLAPGGAVMDGQKFSDFVIQREDGWDGWVDLLGIESPGLTSCLAIAERVEALLYK